MSAPNASIAIPKYDIDKVVAATTVTFSGGASSVSFPGVSTYALPIGIFSTDNGATWNDFADYGLVGGFTIVPSSTCNITVDSTGNVYVSGTGGNPITKIALLALNNTTVATPPLFTGSLLYSSKLSYMKIAKEGSYTQNTTSHVTTTIAHNLGYVPFFQVFILDKLYSTDYRWRRGNALFGNAGSISEGARADATNIYITPTSFSPSQLVTVYYRIYYEN